MRDLCMDGVEGDAIWGAYAFQENCPCAQPTVHISSEMRQGNDNNTRIGVRWDPPSKKMEHGKLYDCYQERATQIDLICVYNLKEIQAAKTT